MKILSHYALDMNQKTKISTKFPRSKVGVATAVLSLGGVLVYSVGMINPLYASQRTNLEVNGVQNRVQYLNTLIVTGETNGVKLQYDKDSVQALGSLNMQNLVVGKGNSSSTSSVVFGGTNNANNGENSFIAWGEGVRVDSSAQNVAVISSQRANVNASNTIVMHGNNINTSQGSNIMVLNAEDKTINGNYVTVLGNSSASADRTFVLGDNIVNEKSNTFVFNGKDGAFIPSQDSAFYANSKVAINADNAKAQLDINGGAMIGIREDRSVPKWNYKGSIARFARDEQLGLCALDGKNNQRIPLSESARKFWLCTETHFVELPRNAVTNDTNRYLPGVWNQKTGRWQKGLWVYGSKNKKGHFLCADGFVPDNSDPIGKTGVKCIACEWAKSGDLNCGETKKVEETTPTCPQGTTYNKTSKKCEGSRETTCMVFPGKQGIYTPNKTIEEFDGTKWVVKQKCQLTCPTGYLKKTDPVGQVEYCAKLEWKCNDSAKSCIERTRSKNYSCQGGKRSTEEYQKCISRCGRFGSYIERHSCELGCENLPESLYNCNGLSYSQCIGNEWKRRWCSWELDMDINYGSSKCKMHSSEVLCTQDTECERGYSREEFWAVTEDPGKCMAEGMLLDSSICEENDIPNLCGNTSLDLSTTCPSGQHLENGACVSNTKTVSCDTRWVVSPANGKVNNTEQVSVTRSEATQSWSKPAKCDVTCNAGYEKKNGKCEKKIKLIRKLKHWDSIGWDCGLQWTYTAGDITSECDTEPPKKAPSYLWEQVDAGEYRENGECRDFAIEWWAAWGGQSSITYSCYWEGVESK